MHAWAKSALVLKMLTIPLSESTLFMPFSKHFFDTLKGIQMDLIKWLQIMVSKYFGISRLYDFQTIACSSNLTHESICSL